MNIDEAIEILDNYLRGDEPDYSLDLSASMRLGIEALKRLEVLRLKPYLDPRDRLPGETEE